MFILHAELILKRKSIFFKLKTWIYIYHVSVLLINFFIKSHELFFLINLYFLLVHLYYGALNLTDLIMQPALQIDVMRDSADTVVSILKSLANTDRLLILCHLAQEELNVSQIEEKLKLLSLPYLNS